MAPLLPALLALNAALHALIVVRFGVKGNEPPLVFGIAYAVLAILTSTGVPYALWATLIVSVVGVAGLTANWAKIPHEKTVEKLCWALGAVIILISAALLFLR